MASVSWLKLITVSSESYSTSTLFFNSWTYLWHETKQDARINTHWIWEHDQDLHLDFRAQGIWMHLQFSILIICPISAIITHIFMPGRTENSFSTAQNNDRKKKAKQCTPFQRVMWRLPNSAATEPARLDHLTGILFNFRKFILHSTFLIQVRFSSGLGHLWKLQAQVIISERMCKPWRKQLSS